MRCSPDQYFVPPDDPLTLASYRAALDMVEAYVEHFSVGNSLVDMPLFLDAEFYVNVPLEATYDAAYRGVPEYCRGILEGQRQVG